MFQEKNKCIDAKFKSFDEIINRKFKEQKEYFNDKLRATNAIKIETFVI